MNIVDSGVRDNDMHEDGGAKGWGKDDASFSFAGLIVTKSFNRVLICKYNGLFY